MGQRFARREGECLKFRTGLTRRASSLIEAIRPESPTNHGVAGLIRCTSRCTTAAVFPMKSVQSIIGAIQRRKALYFPWVRELSVT